MSTRSVATNTGPMSLPHGATPANSWRVPTTAPHTPSTPTRPYSEPDGAFECPLQPPRAGMADEPPSPPASPWAVHPKRTVAFECGDEPPAPDQCSHDPPLYRDGTATSRHEPLFAKEEESEVHHDWTADIAYHFVKPKSKNDTRRLRYRWPTEEETLRMVPAKISICKTYNSQPGLYLSRVRDENGSRRPPKRSRVGAPELARPPDLKARPPHLKRDDRQANGDPAKKAPRTRTTPKPSTNRPSGLVERPKVPHTRAPSIKRPEDIHFDALPDFSPPTAGLPNSKALKIEWSSHNALDLSNDPHRHLLHDAELALASTLRLSCATYLCSKRRIFIKVRDAYQAGKEFRKTDAQQACQIDVNKASKLWIVFEKVGWFNRAHFAGLQDREGHP